MIAVNRPQPFIQGIELDNANSSTSESKRTSALTAASPLNRFHIRFERGEDLLELFLQHGRSLASGSAGIGHP